MSLDDIDVSNKNFSVVDGTVACSVCERALSGSGMISGTCTSQDCDRPICQRCWTTVGRQECPAHFGGTSSTEETSPKATSPRLLMTNFLDSFVANMESRPHVETEEGQTVTKVRSWSNARTDKRDGLLTSDARAGGRSKSARPGAPSYNDGWFVRYVLPAESAFLSTSMKRLEIEARVTQPVAQRNRYSNAQAGSLDALEVILKSASELSREKGSKYLLGPFSPDGWTGDAQGLIAPSTSGPGHTGPNLSVLLVGPTLSDVVWNSGDRVMSGLSHYYRAGYLGEVAQCRKAMEQSLSSSNVRLLSQFVDDHGLTMTVARSAMQQMLADDEIKVVIERGEEALVLKKER